MKTKRKETRHRAVFTTVRWRGGNRFEVKLSFGRPQTSTKRIDRNFRAIVNGPMV